jgi:hypothetical protein
VIVQVRRHRRGDFNGVIATPFAGSHNQAAAGDAIARRRSPHPQEIGGFRLVTARHPQGPADQVAFDLSQAIVQRLDVRSRPPHRHGSARVSI